MQGEFGPVRIPLPPGLAKSRKTSHLAGMLRRGSDDVVLVLLHGLASTMRSGTISALSRVRPGSSALLFDMPGAEDSGGEYSLLYADDLEVLECVLRYAAGELPGRRVVLVGHSRGAALALLHAQSRGGRGEDPLPTLAVSGRAFQREMPPWITDEHQRALRRGECVRMDFPKFKSPVVFTPEVMAERSRIDYLSTAHSMAARGLLVCVHGSGDAVSPWQGSAELAGLDVAWAEQRVEGDCFEGGVARLSGAAVIVCGAPHNFAGAHDLLAGEAEMALRGLCGAGAAQP